METLRLIGEIVLSSTVAAGIVLAVMRWLALKWFDHQFSKRLEQFKREQSELLEQYRYQINARFNRITKIHEKEFEVLPEAWHKLLDAYSHLASITLPLQQWPDLNHYTAAELESFLNTCELPDFQKEELRKAGDKQGYYEEKAYWVRLGTASKKFNEFRNYLRYNKIFLSRDLFELFTQIEKAMIDVQVQLQYPDGKPWGNAPKGYQALTTTVSELLIKVEDVVQKRLNFDQA